MAARSSIAPFGPIHLRHLLRARMDPGERLVGFAVTQLRPTPAQIITHVGLALLPGVGPLAALALATLGPDQRRLVVLTTRRLLLLRLNRSGPDPSGRGVLADLPLATLAENPPPAPPYNHAPPAPAADVPGPAHMPSVTPTTARRGGILGPNRAATPRPPHPPAVRRRIQL